METECKSNPNQKNEVAPNPDYNWLDITQEFFESIKGITSKYLLQLLCKN